MYISVNGMIERFKLTSKYIGQLKCSILLYLNNMYITLSMLVHSYHIEIYLLFVLVSGITKTSPCNEDPLTPHFR